MRDLDDRRVPNSRGSSAAPSRGSLLGPQVTTPCFRPSSRGGLAACFRVNIEAGGVDRARRLRAASIILRTREYDDAGPRGGSEIAAGELSRHEVPGDTFSMLRPPHVQVVGPSRGRPSGTDMRVVAAAHRATSAADVDRL